MSSIDHPFLRNPDKALFIGGKWVDAIAGRRMDAINPADGHRIATLAEGDAADIDAAVAAARHALEQGPWPRFTPAERQGLLLRIADLLEARSESFAVLDTLDMGKPVRFTRGAIPLLVDLLRYFAGAARTIHGSTPQTSLPGMFAATVKEPVGVCGAIIPWNGPLWASVLKIGPVLATGCTLVLKPAEDASLAPLMFADLCAEAGVPPGVINVVTGLGPTAGAALAAHMDVDKMSFTGSDATGRRIVQASAGNLKRLSLELGGKSPHIIFADADLAAAAPAAAMAVFVNSGQVCSAGTRLFVERSIHDAFVEAVVAHAGALRFGDGLSADTDLGPVVSARQHARVLGYVEAGVAGGARLVSGGDRPAGDAFGQGFYVNPTVFCDVADDMRIAREEIFGPVLAIFPFDSEDEVVRRANDTPFGLGAGMWTRDVGRAHRVGGALKAGSVWVNCYNALDPAVPSGGYKASGWGREYGPNHLEEHLNVKSLWIQT
ncbi:MAG: aldehyde dehydrogenase family protein [Novosphingobium sp.]|nr:aldehyde dehydrogenase family protein [Novosphingobium sp.]